MFNNSFFKFLLGFVILIALSIMIMAFVGYIDGGLKYNEAQVESMYK